MLIDADNDADGDDAAADDDYGDIGPSIMEQAIEIRAWGH